MNNEEKKEQARLLVDALKANVSGSWLNHGSLLLKPERGVTPFQNIMKAIALDNGDHKGWHTPQEPEWKEFSARLDDFAAKVKEHLAPIEHDSDGADYDAEKKVILMPEKDEYDNLIEYAHDLFSAASLATGTPDRLDRPGVVLDSNNPKSGEDEKREQLVGELVSAALCIEEGKAASLAPSSVDTIEEWEKYIADNPEHFDGIMEDVDKAVLALREIRRGRKPDYEKIAAKTVQTPPVPEQKAASQEKVKTKTQTEQKAAERQISLLAVGMLKALERNGIWMNNTGKLYPGFYPKGPAISPFNAISLALHSDENGYRSNLYTTFQEAKSRNEGVKASEKGVPFNWYNWNQYVNRNNPDDIISRKDYLALSKEEKTQYKGIHNREIRTLFNIDQTMTPVIDPDHYKKAVGWNGSEKERGMDGMDDKIRRETFDKMLDSIDENLVPVVRGQGQPVARYDMGEDVVRIPEERSYVYYHDYVHDTIAEVVRSTGHAERLARESAVNNKTQDDLLRESLVVELATGVKMLELGMPARLSPASQEMVHDWIRILKEDPKMIDAVETDLNNALEVINKAERGEKVVYSSFVNQQKARQLQDKQKPQVTTAESLVLADIIRHHGMEIHNRNFTTPEEKEAFLEKFDMTFYHSQIESARESLRSDDPDVVEAAYSEIYNHAAAIDELAREYRPAEWNIKGRRDIEEMLHENMDDNPKDMIIIMDEKTRKADVILPQGAFTGGKVTMPNGQERNFYVSPDEVLCQEERKDARIQFNEASGFSKARIEHALEAHPAFKPSFVRFFNRDGVAAFHADDRYFEGKQVAAARLNRWELDAVRDIDVREQVALSRSPLFEKVLMLKDDDNRWMLFMQAQGEKPFSVYPDKADINKFFTASHQGNAAITAAVRQELAVKYYELAKVKPSLQVDVLGDKASEEDAARLQRVNIFKNKNGQFMIIAKVTDTPKDMPPREISAAQWQRLWLSPNHDEYKKDLAARIFADVLHPERQQKEETKQTEQARLEPNPEVKDAKTESKLMKQYLDLKAKHPNAILLFRTGDFYETYKDDAVKASKILGITLTRSSKTRDDEGKPLAMAGFPYHALDTYLPKLIRAGERVAICDQIESPRHQTEQAPKEEETRSSHFHR